MDGETVGPDANLSEGGYDPPSLPRLRFPEYRVAWSEAGGMFVASSPQFPGHWAGSRDVASALDVFLNYLDAQFGDEGVGERLREENRRRGYSG